MREAFRGSRPRRDRRAALNPEQRAAEDKAAADRATKAAAETKLTRLETEAELHSQTYVRQFLRYPDDANFGFWTTLEITCNEQQDVFHVRSTVKAKNGFGAELTSRWETIIFLDESTWRLVSCLIDGKQVYSSKELLARLQNRAR